MAEDWIGIAEEVAEEFAELSSVDYHVLYPAARTGPEFRPEISYGAPVQCYAMGVKMTYSDQNRVEEEVEGKFRVSSHGLPSKITTECRFVEGGKEHSILSVSPYRPGGVTIYYDILVSP